MSELSPKAQALLEAARRSHGPKEDERERVLAGLHVSLGIAGALPMLSDASTANAASSGPQLAQPHAPSLPPPPPVVTPNVLPVASKALGWSKLAAWKAGKVYLATLVLGGSAVGVTMVPRSDDDVQSRQTAAMVAPQEENVVAAPAVARQPVVEAPVVAEAVVAEAVVAEPVVAEPVVAEPVVEAAEIEAPVRAHVARSEVRSAPRRVQARHEDRRRARVERELLAQDIKPAEEPKPVAPAQDLAAAVGVGSTPSPELALIRAALTSLRDRDSSQALRLLDEHAARYPSGAFSTERRALHVVALCAAGRNEEGARERAQFLKTSGDSPIAARVRSACPR